MKYSREKNQTFILVFILELCFAIELLSIVSLIFILLTPPCCWMDFCWVVVNSAPPGLAVNSQVVRLQPVGNLLTQVFSSVYNHQIPHVTLK